MNQIWGENECEILTHSQQEPWAPKTHKKGSTARLTTRITMLCPPPPPTVVVPAVGSVLTLFCRLVGSLVAIEFIVVGYTHTKHAPKMSEASLPMPIF